MNSGDILRMAPQSDNVISTELKAVDSNTLQSAAGLARKVRKLSPSDKLLMKALGINIKNEQERLASLIEAELQTRELN